jgi:hypothetical protein
VRVLLTAVSIIGLVGGAVVGLGVLYDTIDLCFTTSSTPVCHVVASTSDRVWLWAMAASLVVLLLVWIGSEISQTTRRHMALMIVVVMAIWAVAITLLVRAYG